jgi:hypothetical protein
MKQIPLTKGKYALVDDEDYEFLNQWKWQVNSDGYAITGVRNQGERIQIRMHRLIINTPKGMETDHINGNRLDNRRDNLRVATKSQNLRNQKKRKSLSLYKGLAYRKRDNAWEVNISDGSKQVFIGSFKNERHAAMAYDIWAKELYGKFAKLNFSSI